MRPAVGGEPALVVRRGTALPLPREEPVGSAAPGWDAFEVGEIRKKRDAGSLARMNKKRLMAKAMCERPITTNKYEKMGLLICGKDHRMNM